MCCACYPADPTVLKITKGQKAMLCHVSSQCHPIMLPASKRRHKLRPISIGLSVSPRDFIRNPSAGISIRNQGCRICVEILGAPPLRSISSAGGEIARCGFLHTQHPSGKYCTGNTLVFTNDTAVRMLVGEKSYVASGNRSENLRPLGISPTITLPNPHRCKITPHSAN